MKKIILLLAILIFISCKENKKIYKIIDIVDEENISGQIERKEIVNIKEYDNDSIASIMAYTFFCLHSKLDKDYADKGIKDYSKAISFKLLNEQNKLIITDKYLTKEIKDKIFKERFEQKSALDFLDKDKVSSKKEEPSLSSYTNYDDDANPCIISKDFIKQDLNNPATADFSMFDCSTDKNSDGTYTVLRKVSAQNSFGVEKEFIYKLKLGFKGGNWVDISNWDLIKIQSEEYK